MTELPSAADNAAVQEALSIRYVDKIGLAWLPTAAQWAVFSNSGKLLQLVANLDEQALQELCEAQNRSWRAEREAEAPSQGPVVAGVALGDLDL